MVSNFTYKGISYDENGKVMVKDERVEIVRMETKERYKKLLEDHLDHVESMKTDVSWLSGLMKVIAINEIIAAERIIDREVRRLVEMVIMDKEGEAFAKQ